MLISVRWVPLHGAEAVTDSLPRGLGREFFKCHLPSVSSNFRKQTLLKGKYPSAKNEKKGTIPGNLKCNLVANAETELKSTFCSAGRNPEACVLRPQLCAPAEETGNQSLCSCSGRHIPVPFAVTLPHPAEVEGIVLQPSPLPSAPRLHPTGSGPLHTATQAALRLTQRVPFPSAATRAAPPGVVRCSCQNTPCWSLCVKAHAYRATCPQLSHSHLCVPAN